MFPKHFVWKNSFNKQTLFGPNNKINVFQVCAHQLQLDLLKQLKKNSKFKTVYRLASILNSEAKCPLKNNVIIFFFAHST